MKANINRIAAVLITAISFLTLPSCGNTSDKPDVTQMEINSTEAESVADPYEKFANLDLKGFEFDILSYDSTSWETYADPETETGDVLNDAAYKRNLEVEEMLNIGINLRRDSAYEATFKNLVMSGDTSTADLIVFWSPGERSGFISGNYVYNWNDIPYVDLSCEWYNQTANDAYSIAGKQFFAVSDFTFTVQQHFRILFNKELVENFGLESPYDAVFDGKWTIDYLLADCKNVYSDLNGNNTPDLADRFGMVLNNAFSSAFPLNAGEIQVKTTPSGFTLNLYSERIITLVEKMISFKSNPDIFVNTSGNDQYNTFYAGNAIYMPYASDPALLRDVQFDFGYLPYPKLDEKQENYVVWSAGGLMAVPAEADDIEKTGAVIEALTIASNKYVKDAFIEKYIEGKVLRDEESQKIYRMMRDLATYDLFYNIDPSGLLSNHGYYSYFMNNNSANVASRWAEIGESIKTKYDELYETVLKN